MTDIKNFDQFLGNNIIKEEVNIVNDKSIEDDDNKIIKEPEIIIEEPEIIDNNEKDIEIESDNGLYKIFRDKEESFTCQIEVDGANISDTYIRLLFITKEWNVFIDGFIDSGGNVEIPIKKMSIFNEGIKGKIKLEVIADNTLFVPWEDDFEVKVSKKVTVKFNESKKAINKSGINVKMK